MSDKRKVRTRAVQIAEGLHTALVALAAQQTIGDASDGKRNPRVTIRAIVEDAVLARWPDLRATADVATEPGADGDGEQVSAELFGRILAALYADPDPVRQGQAIDGLAGSVIGTYGERLKLQDLAYHLRGADRPIATMEDLVRDYEAQH